MSERTTAAATADRPAVTAPAADPAPLGLAAFALTTFLLSGFNAGWMTKAGGLSWLGYAFGYGGFVLLLAGMWEFRNRNVFGATWFSSYSGFWLGLAVYFIVPGGGVDLITAGKVSEAQKDLGWILLAFALFNTYMLVWSTQVNMAVFGVFATLELTEIILFIGNFAGSAGVIKAGGYLGVLTALVAWYASAAGLINGMRGMQLLPVGKPFLTLGR